jgi:hypothetical protein
MGSGQIRSAVTFIRADSNTLVPWFSFLQILRSWAEERRLSTMKTMTVREAKPQLGKLVQKVQHNGPVIIVQGDKLAKLERYELLDPECDCSQLETMLLEAVQGPHKTYSRKELDAILDKVSASHRRR